jgi:hypothetical protein
MVSKKASTSKGQEIADQWLKYYRSKPIEGNSKGREGGSIHRKRLNMGYNNRHIFVL